MMTQAHMELCSDDTDYSYSDNLILCIVRRTYFLTFFVCPYRDEVVKSIAKYKKKKKGQIELTFLFIKSAYKDVLYFGHFF